MAKANFFKDTFGKVRDKLEGFLYHDESNLAAPMPSMNDEGYAPQEGYPPQQQAASAYSYQQPVYQQQPYQAPQAAYQPQQGYQTQPGAYQAYQQPVYQQPQPEQPRQPVYQAPAQPQAEAYTRNRRAERTAQRQESNVVDFSSYQQQAQPEAEISQQPAAASARIINARGIGDCRSAITLLRNGDTVLIVLENISEPAEMRRLVDTLSGACYSLTATITKVSRAGVYLLAPQSMAVYADQATNQMNMAPARAAARPNQAAYAGQPIQRPPYQAPAYQQPYQQPAYAAPQNGFSQRAAAEEAPMQPFYSRQPAQSAQIPPFSAQPAGYGYSPDESAAAEQ